MRVIQSGFVLITLLAALLLLLCLLRPRQRVAVETFGGAGTDFGKPQSLYVWFSEKY